MGALTVDGEGEGEGDVKFIQDVLAEQDPEDLVAEEQLRKNNEVVEQGAHTCSKTIHYTSSLVGSSYPSSFLCSCKHT